MVIVHQGQNIWLDNPAFRGAGKDWLDMNPVHQETVHNPADDNIEYEKVTETIIGCANRVYNEMGFGFLEPMKSNWLIPMLLQGNLLAWFLILEKEELKKSTKLIVKMENFIEAIKGIEDFLKDEK